MYSLLRNILFLLPAEKAHYFTLNILRLILCIPGMKGLFKKIFNPKNQSDESVELFGIRFPNRIGLAAGFDKDARYIHELSTLGFGFLEIGTLTPLPQEGNPKPRLFRLPEDQALINRMGFNNGGVLAAIERLKKRPKNRIIGGNIGKNKITPNDEAVEDYKKAFDALFPYVDYFTVNVSSPNTPGLRELQSKKPLLDILNQLQLLNKQKEKRKAILLKIAPDLSLPQLDDILEIVSESKIDGLIVSNTTIERTGLKTAKNQLEAIGNGGLSGAPLMQKSTEIVRYLSEKSNGKVPIIAAGGIMNGEDALAKIKAGASLVQIYTGFIYRGPGFVKELRKAISNS
ncbi:MAG: quinone-dependent dihydroorotate dehydrogenase [Chitinophagales bacterium]